MQSPQKWRHQTAFNVAQAQQLKDLAGRQADLSQRAREDLATHHLGMTSELGATLAQKVSDSSGLIETLERRAESLENSIHRASQSLAQLEQAYSAKEVPLHVCESRMEQRKARPARELVHDAVEISLEEERAVLLEAQRKLGDAGKKTKAVLAELTKKLEKVRLDVEEKKQALGVDEMCLRTADSTFQTSLDRTMRSETSRSDLSSAGLSSPGRKRFNAHDPLALHEGIRNELIRQRKVAYVDQLISSREQAATALLEENASLLAETDRATEEATATTNRRLKERADESQQARNKLESELNEMHSKIEQVVGTITETRVHMKALDEPMALNSSCTAWRRQRGRREDITDPVSAMLKDHQETVHRAHQELSGQQHKEQATLGSLQERRQKLVDDIRDKTLALNIDRGCIVSGSGQALPGSRSNNEPGRADHARLGTADSTLQKVLGSAASPSLRTPRLPQADMMFSPRRTGGPLQLTARQLTSR